MRIRLLRYFGASILLLVSIAEAAIPTPKNRLYEEERSARLLENWILIPQMSIVTPWAFELRNSRFTVPYSENFTGMPLVGIGAARRLFEEGAFTFYGQGQLAFTTKGGVYALQTASGSPVLESVHMQWVPVSASFKAIYHIPKINFIKPMLSLGAGVEWLHQGGQSSGLSDHFFLPFYSISPGLVFMENRNTSDWFGGFNFSLTYIDTISRTQTLRGLSVDLGFNINL